MQDENSSFVKRYVVHSAIWYYKLYYKTWKTGKYRARFHSYLNLIQLMLHKGISPAFLAFSIFRVFIFQHMNMPRLCRVLNIPECLKIPRYALSSLNIPEHVWICQNMPKSAWMSFLYVSPLYLVYLNVWILASAFKRH